MAIKKILQLYAEGFFIDLPAKEHGPTQYVAFMYPTIHL